MDNQIENQFFFFKGIFESSLLLRLVFSFSKEYLNQYQNGRYIPYYALFSGYPTKTQIKIGNSLCPDQNGNEALRAAKLSALP
jgi:hypothetical protein